MSMQPDTPIPHVVSWNLTARCNLDCDHCYIDASRRMSGDEADTDACLRTVEQIAELNTGALLILTGGEPLLRPDLDRITLAAADAGMTVVIGTNGTLLTEERARRLQAFGVSGVGISIDSLRPELHDHLRGREGSLAAALAGLDAARRVGLESLIQTSVFEWNREELDEIAEFAAQRGVTSWNVYFLVCTGRGQGLTDISPEKYEESLERLRTIRERMAGRLMVVVRCAPQFRRVVAEAAEESAPLPAFAGGCPAATHYLRIGPHGEVTPCPYMPTTVGSLEEESLARLWASAPLLERLRDRGQLEGDCGACSYRDSCGGCRARALALAGDAMAADPSCLYEPDANDGPVREPEAVYALPTERTMPWTVGALQRIERVPSFVRGMVVQRIEDDARKRGLDQIDEEIVRAARERAAKHAPRFLRGVLKG